MKLGPTLAVVASATVPLAVAWRCHPPPRPRCPPVAASAPPLAELAREQAELTLEEQAFADSFDDDEAARAALQAKQAWLVECAAPFGAFLHAHAAG